MFYLVKMAYISDRHGELHYFLIFKPQNLGSGLNNLQKEAQLILVNQLLFHRIYLNEIPSHLMQNQL